MSIHKARTASISFVRGDIVDRGKKVFTFVTHGKLDASIGTLLIQLLVILVIM